MIFNNNNYIILFSIVLIFICLILIGNNNPSPNPNNTKTNNTINNILRKAQKIIVKEQFTSSTTSEPISSTTSEPISSTTSEPISSTTSEPISSTTSEPISSTTSEPISSTTSEPISSTTSEPEPTTSVYITETPKQEPEQEPEPEPEQEQEPEQDKETFTLSEELSDNALSQLQQGIKEIQSKEDPVTTTGIISKSSGSSSYDFENVEDIVNQLDDLENKCSIYETKQNEKYIKERDRLKEIYNEQLEIEEKKIEHLTEIVNHYRQRYQTKLKINNKCRKDNQTKIKHDIDLLSNLNIKNKPASIEVNGVKCDSKTTKSPIKS